MPLTAVCPPCGHVHTGETEDELVRSAQAHALEKHGHVPDRERIVATIKSAAAPRDKR